MRKILNKHAQTEHITYINKTEKILQHTGINNRYVKALREYTLTKGVKQKTVRKITCYFDIAVQNCLDQPAVLLKAASWNLRNSALELSFLSAFYWL